MNIMNEPKKEEKETKILTTVADIPVDNNQNSLTAGPRGLVFLQNFKLLNKLATFNREHISERVAGEISRC